MMVYNHSMRHNTASEAMIFFFHGKKKNADDKNIEWKTQDVCGEEGKV